MCSTHSRDGWECSNGVLSTNPIHHTGWDAFVPSVFRGQRTTAPVQQFVPNSAFMPRVQPEPAKPVPVDQHVPGSAFSADAEIEETPAKRVRVARATDAEMLAGKLDGLSDVLRSKCTSAHCPQGGWCFNALLAKVHGNDSDRLNEYCTRHISNYWGWSQQDRRGWLHDTLKDAAVFATKARERVIYIATVPVCIEAFAHVHGVPTSAISRVQTSIVSGAELQPDGRNERSGTTAVKKSSIVRWIEYKVDMLADDLPGKENDDRNNPVKCLWMSRAALHQLYNDDAKLPGVGHDVCSQNYFYGVLVSEFGPKRWNPDRVQVRFGRDVTMSQCNLCETIDAEFAVANDDDERVVIKHKKQVHINAVRMARGQRQLFVQRSFDAFDSWTSVSTDASGSWATRIPRTNARGKALKKDLTPLLLENKVQIVVVFGGTTHRVMVPEWVHATTNLQIGMMLFKIIPAVIDAYQNVHGADSDCRCLHIQCDRGPDQWCRPMYAACEWLIANGWFDDLILDTFECGHGHFDADADGRQMLQHTCDKGAMTPQDFLALLNQIEGTQNNNGVTLQHVGSTLTETFDFKTWLTWWDISGTKAAQHFRFRRTGGANGKTAEVLITAKKWNYDSAADGSGAVTVDTFFQADAAGVRILPEADSSPEFAQCWDPRGGDYAAVARGEYIKKVGKLRAKISQADAGVRATLLLHNTTPEKMVEQLDSWIKSIPDVHGVAEFNMDGSAAERLCWPPPWCAGKKVYTPPAVVVQQQQPTDRPTQEEQLQPLCITTQRSTNPLRHMGGVVGESVKALLNAARKLRANEDAQPPCKPGKIYIVRVPDTDNDTPPLFLARHISGRITGTLLQTLTNDGGGAAAANSAKFRWLVPVVGVDAEAGPRDIAQGSKGWAARVQKGEQRNDAPPQVALCSWGVRNEGNACSEPGEWGSVKPCAQIEAAFVGPGVEMTRESTSKPAKLRVKADKEMMAKVLLLPPNS